MTEHAGSPTYPRDEEEQDGQGESANRLEAEEDEESGADSERKVQARAEWAGPASLTQRKGSN